jgi:hypothetical protein
VMARILNKFNIQTPDEFVQLEWNVRCLPCQRLVCDAVGLERVHDFQLWLKPWGIHACNHLTFFHSSQCRSSLTDAETIALWLQRST